LGPHEAVYWYQPQKENVVVKLKFLSKTSSEFANAREVEINFKNFGENIRPVIVDGEIIGTKQNY
jgi:hypothetical protein